jgi:hypothetical protein
MNFFLIFLLDRGKILKISEISEKNKN